MLKFARNMGLIFDIACGNISYTKGWSRVEMKTLRIGEPIISRIIVLRMAMHIKYKINGF